MFTKLIKKLDLTDQWQVRCPTCNKTRNMADFRGKRIAPRSMTKRTFGKCTQCGGFKWLIIEALPATTDSQSN